MFGFWGLWFRVWDLIFLGFWVLVLGGRGFRFGGLDVGVLGLG